MRSLPLSVIAIVFAPAAAAQELTLGFGYADIQASEYVYGDSGERLSYLDWSGGARVVTLGYAFPVNGWSLSVSGAISVDGSFDMTDYDWLHEDYGYSFGEWSDRSSHPDTRLSSYYKIEVEALRSVGEIQVGAGVGFTAFKAAAYGGSYIYSEDGGYRNEVGTNPDGEVGITYSQDIPYLYAIANGSHSLGQGFTLGWSGRLGVSFNVRDKDIHHNRDLVFRDEMEAAPYFGATVAVSKEMGRGSLTASIDYDRHWDRKGDVSIYSASTGEFQESASDGAGMGFTAVTVNVGYAVRF